MASHIFLPREGEEDEQEEGGERGEEFEEGLPVAVEADFDSPSLPRPPHTGKLLPFSASCVRISRDSYPNLRALRAASVMSLEEARFAKIVEGEFGYILDDVPHFSDYLPDLPTYPNPLQDHPAYSTVRQYFVNVDDTVPEKVVVQKDSPRGLHFRRAGPRQRVFFESDDVKACIVTCGGLCPGLNTVIRELVCGLSHMYNVNKIFGIQNGYKGFYSSNYLPLTPKSVNDIHKRGGTILGTSRGGHDTKKIVDNIQDRGINQVYIIGGDGTQKGASEIFKEIRKRGLKVAVAGIPKTIDNDIAVIDKSFGFDSAVEEAQRAINAAHVESESAENGIGLVKLMGRYSGFIAMYATLASRDVDCCLIPESPFYMEGEGGLFEYIEKRLKENKHMVIVVAEGAGQDLIAQSIPSAGQQDASGNKLLLDIGLWLTHKIKDYCKSRKMEMTIKYIDPTYMIRAIPSNASDNVYCTLLAHSAIHGAMAGYSFTVGMVNGRHTYIPFHRVTSKRNKVSITDRMWARLLSSTNQPSFLSKQDVEEARAANRLASRPPVGTSHHGANSDKPSMPMNVLHGVENHTALPPPPATIPEASTPAPCAGETNINVKSDNDLSPPHDSSSDAQSDQHDTREVNPEMEAGSALPVKMTSATPAHDMVAADVDMKSDADRPPPHDSEGSDTRSDDHGTQEEKLAAVPETGEKPDVAASAARPQTSWSVAPLGRATGSAYVGVKSTADHPPSHFSEGWNTQSDDHGTQEEKPREPETREKKPDVSAPASGLQTSRSFARHCHAKGCSDPQPFASSPPARMPSPGARQAQGKVLESKDHKAKEPARRLWR